MNWGFGVSFDGTPIIPRYDPMSDPREYDLFFNPVVIRFFRQFKAGVPMNEEPAYARMIRAGFYDGLGTMLPLGAYWQKKIAGRSFTGYRMDVCFDIFSFDRLRNWAVDDELRAYVECLQVDRFEDSLQAFINYLAMRGNPSYVCQHELPDYMVDADGLIIDCPKDDPFRPHHGGWWEHSDIAKPLADEWDL